MCKYCDTTKGTIVIDSNIMDGEGISISLDVKTGDLIVDTEFDSGCVRDFMNTPINYCPMCGRKL